MEAVLQEPEANCGLAVGEPVDGRRGIGAVHADEELCVVGELHGGMTRRVTRSARQQLTRIGSEQQRAEH